MSSRKLSAVDVIAEILKIYYESQIQITTNKDRNFANACCSGSTITIYERQNSIIINPYYASKQGQFILDTMDLNILDDVERIILDWGSFNLLIPNKKRAVACGLLPV